MSVAIPVWRPIGPAATDAFAPRVSRPFSMPSTPLRVLNTRITSVDCTPACQPTLPPVILMNAGLLHELSSCRTTITPLPRLAPKPNAALTTLGNTATPYARDNNAGGIVLSGIRRNCSRTSAASPTRFSSREAASAVLVSSMVASATTVNRIFEFMFASISQSLWSSIIRQLRGPGTTDVRGSVARGNSALRRRHESTLPQRAIICRHVLLLH